MCSAAFGVGREPRLPRGSRVRFKGFGHPCGRLSQRLKKPRRAAGPRRGRRQKGRAATSVCRPPSVTFLGSGCSSPGRLHIQDLRLVMVARGSRLSISGPLQSPLDSPPQLVPPRRYGNLLWKARLRASNATLVSAFSSRIRTVERSAPARGTTCVARLSWEKTGALTRESAAGRDLRRPRAGAR